jgi:hypothetical protein
VSIRSGCLAKPGIHPAYDGYVTVQADDEEAAVRQAERQLQSGSFPDDAAIRKVLYLALKQASRKWAIPIPNWNAALNHVAILFGEHMPK